MAVGSKDLISNELRGFDDDRLVDELRKAKEELFNLRFQSATGQLDNHGRLRAVRKDIARIYTEMRERELGIYPAGEVAEPGPAATSDPATTDPASSDPVSTDSASTNKTSTASTAPAGTASTGSTS